MDSIGKGCVIEANTTIHVNAVVKDGFYVCVGALLSKGTKLNRCSIWKVPVVAKPIDGDESFSQIGKKEQVKQ